jgi:hypothetical protein
MKQKPLALTFGLLLVSFTALHAQQPGTLLWTYPANITTSAAIAPDGTIYVGNNLGLLAVTNAGTSASNKWVFSTSGGDISSTPAIGADGTIYFGSYSSNLFAVNPDGSLKWAYAFAGKVPASPAIGADGTIYIPAEGYLYAINPNGTRKWKSFVLDERCSPVIGPDGTLYLGNPYGTMFFAINPDGTQKWAVDLGSGSGESAAVGGDGSIYITAGGLDALDPGTGTNRWSGTVPCQGSSPVVGRDGTIYVQSSWDMSLTAYTPAGQLKWQASSGPTYSGSQTVSPAIDAAGITYNVASNAVFAITPQGTIQWVLGTGGGGIPFHYTSPSIGPDGVVYVGINSVLHAIKGTNALGNTPWPMYRQNLRHTGKVEKPALQAPKKRADANFQFQLAGEVGQSYTIQRSADLSLWSTFTNLVATNPPATFVDLSATNFNAGFYRAVLQ